MRSRSYNAPLMLLAVIALLAAVWAGLVRLGWSLPSLQPQLPMAHGPLMIAGFLGTLISLERVYALTLVFETRWLYVVPLLTGIGGLLLALGTPGTSGPVMITLGSLGMSFLFAVMLRRQPALFTVVLLLGAVVWFIFNVLWLFGRSIPLVVWGWAAFLVLTIAGERLELSQLNRRSPLQRRAFLLIVIVMLAALGLSIRWYSMGVRLVGLANLLLALWLLGNDIARRTVKQTGLPRFIALCMLTGYIWLATAGILAIRFGAFTAGLYYDAMLHAIFLGFTFSMIFGHAPIIFPALLGVRLPFHPFNYVHLVLLHLSLMLRVTGDLTAWMPGRRWGGLFNVFVLLLFFVSTAMSVARGRRTPPSANA